MPTPKQTKLSIPHYLIFDFDGVIADSIDSIAFALKSGWLQFRFLPVIIIKKLIINAVNKPIHSTKQVVSLNKKINILKDYQHIAKILVTQGRTKVFDGFIYQLHKIMKTKNCKLAIVSSGSEIYINSVLKNIDLPFEYIYGVETSLSKENKVRLVCQNWKINLDQCVYFTDSKTDVIELNQILKLEQIIGCAWGFQGYKKLKQILPENQILKEFTDVKFVL